MSQTDLCCWHAALMTPKIVFLYLWTSASQWHHGYYPHVGLIWIIGAGFFRLDDHLKLSVKKTCVVENMVLQNCQVSVQLIADTGHKHRFH